MKVCHLTSVHGRQDTRIFLKECRSLANAGYETILLVADGLGNELKEGVRIIDVGASRHRVDRMYRTTRRLLDLAVAIDPGICHLHDPELMPLGVRLKRLGRKVIFDAHEDAPRQLLTKPYLSRPARIVLSSLVKVYEHWAGRYFDAIIGATPFITQKFARINKRTETINNFPLWGELSVDPESRQPGSLVCYIGGISLIRGIREMVRAFEWVHSSEVRLTLAGSFPDSRLRAEVADYPGWLRVDVSGFVDRKGVREILATALAGLVTFHPVPNHVDAQPNKMFEYMSAGVPLIASDFPLWREIVLGNQCGLCVDPMNPQAIAAAIDYLVSHREQAVQMGENGQRAVRERYNWSHEEAKLLSLYERITRVP